MYSFGVMPVAFLNERKKRSSRTEPAQLRQRFQRIFGTILRGDNRFEFPNTEIVHIIIIAFMKILVEKIRKRMGSGTDHNGQIRHLQVRTDIRLPLAHRCLQLSIQALALFRAQLVGAILVVLKRLGIQAHLLFRRLSAICRRNVFLLRFRVLSNKECSRNFRLKRSNAFFLPSQETRQPFPEEICSQSQKQKECSRQPPCRTVRRQERHVYRNGRIRITDAPNMITAVLPGKFVKNEFRLSYQRHPLVIAFTSVFIGGVAGKGIYKV